MGLVIFAAGQAGGCTTKRFHKTPWFVTQQDAAGYVEVALGENHTADVRRDAIVRLSKTRFARHDTVVEACGLIARRDSSASVRAVAIRLLAESRRPDAASTLVSISDMPDLAPRVRVDVLNAIYFLQRNGAIPQQQDDRAVEAAIRLLKQERSRDVHIAAARLLGETPSLDGLRALIDALNHEDFGVVYQAERSLNRLTGVRHDHDPPAWKAWLASADAPFGMRGRLDAELDPPARPKWWQRMAKSMKQALAGFRPK